MNLLSAPFDFVFINPDFEDFIFITDKIYNGAKISIVLDNDLQREDIFYTTYFYPRSIFSVKRNLKHLKIWQRLVRVAPHLAHSQKVFYPVYSKFDKYRALIADYFYENTYQKRSEIVSQNSGNIPSKLNKSLGEGIYFQEYRFNISRFYIEMLKYLKENGAEVFINQSFYIEKSSLIFEDTGLEIQTKQIIQSKNSLNTVYEFPFDIPAGFSMVVNTSQGKLRFSERDNFLVVESLNDSKKSFSKNELIDIIKNGLQFNLQNVEIKEKQYFPFLLDEISPVFSSIIQSFPCSFEEKDFEDMFELCREKFDLAKQCGISYREFQVLFHRYGKGIDEMIEMAYQKMNDQSDLKTIWEAVEDDYQKEHEWKL